VPQKFQNSVSTEGLKEIQEMKKKSEEAMICVFTRTTASLVARERISAQETTRGQTLSSSSFI